MFRKYIIVGIDMNYYERVIKSNPERMDRKRNQWRKWYIKNKPTERKKKIREIATPTSCIINWEW